MAQQRRNIANCQIENVFSSVITIMSFHGSYIQCKCKRKRKWKCKRVHTSNANAKKERYGSAVEVFFQDSRQRLSFCRFTRVGSKRKCKLKKMKSCSLPAFKLAFAFALALGWFTRAILCICICVCVCWGCPCVIDWPKEVWVLILLHS